MTDHKNTCPHCDGTGKVLTLLPPGLVRDCPDCDGSGTLNSESDEWLRVARRAREERAREEDDLEHGRTLMVADAERQPTISVERMVNAIRGYVYSVDGEIVCDGTRVSNEFHRLLAEVERLRSLIPPKGAVVLVPIEGEVVPEPIPRMFVYRAATRDFLSVDLPVGDVPVVKGDVELLRWMPAQEPQP